jgi:hypothetical protein
MITVILMVRIMFVGIVTIDMVVIWRGWMICVYGWRLMITMIMMLGIMFVGIMAIDVVLMWNR